MLYVEWQRVYRCLRVLAIVLAACIVLVGVLWAVGSRMLRDGTLVGMLDNPGTTVTKRTLPNGTVQTIFSNPKTHERFVVTDKGWHGKTIVGVHPAAKKPSDIGKGITVGSVRVSQPDANHVVVATDTGFDVGIFFGLTSLIGLIIATCLGAPLAREGERLEAIWTKPIDRSRYAIRAYGINVLGIVIAQLLTAIAILAIWALFEMPRFSAGPSSWWAAALAFAGPIAWYGMYAGLTGWMKRGLGTVLGVAWPVGLFLPVLAYVFGHGNAIAWTFKFLATIDPLFYMNVTSHGSSAANSGIFGDIDVQAKLLIMVVVALVGMLAGILEWQRVEA